uniref:Uncharacterized protein n=1 Tax=Anguilla anguilla TaxID=7936 RepID=A0A0E9WTP8_ANGAN
MEVKQLWLQVEKWLRSTLKVNMDLTPSVSLLKDIRSAQMKIQLEWILLFSSFISKKLLLKNWKSSMCPSLQEWKM